MAVTATQDSTSDWGTWGSGQVLRDRRGTLKAEIPDVDPKSGGMGDDPLASYEPTGAKNVDAAKAMGNFTGGTYAAVNAIASEVANIQLRLYQVTGDKHEEQQDHELLTLLNGVNEQMTGIVAIDGSKIKPQLKPTAAIFARIKRRLPL